MQGTLIQTFGTLLVLRRLPVPVAQIRCRLFQILEPGVGGRVAVVDPDSRGPVPVAWTGDWAGDPAMVARGAGCRVRARPAVCGAVGSSLAAQGFRSWPRSLFLPAVVLLVYATALVFGLGPRVYAAELVLIYAYSFFSIGLRTSSKHSVGGLMLRLSLAWLSCLQLGPATGALAGSVWEFVAQGLLVFSGLAMWIQIQQDSIVQLRTELDSLEKTAAGSSELDH